MEIKSNNFATNHTNQRESAFRCLSSGSWIINRVFLIVIIFMFVSPVFAESTDTSAGDAGTENKLFVTFNYGAAASWLTRIIEQTERSNFVLRDFLPGLFFATEFQNIPYVTPAVRLAVFYPLVSTFNYMPQMSNTPLHYALDFFAGGRFELEWRFLRFTAGPGLHMFFMTADRWTYFNLGAAAVAGIELAISPGWSLLIDGFASIDNGNLGTNRMMEPFNITYQYQATIGARYSKKKRNGAALIVPAEKPLEKPLVILDR